MAFVKANLTKPFSVPDLAKELGISNQHLLRAFRRVLNQSVVDSIRDERINRAKTLLQQTKLSITAIAFETGFDSYEFFAKTFREKVGTNAMDYRKKVRLLGEPAISEHEGSDFEVKQEWFQDLFRNISLEPHWEPIRGKWQQEQNSLVGSGADCAIALLKPLPENCSISFLAKTKLQPDLSEASIYLLILDEARNQSYHGFMIATGKGMAEHLPHFRVGSQWSAGAHISEEEWHRIVVEIREETITLLVDGKEMFSFRDPFPSAYSRRCSLNFGSYHCDLSMREFAIHNLGFSPAIRPIRQGDLLYNTGMVEKALGFYLRYLQAGPLSDEETMELRYKIGMCYLRSGFFSQARAWLDKVVSLRDNKFWAQQAQLSQLELYWRAGDEQNLLEHTRGCLKNPNTQGQARVILQSAVDDLWARGFYSEAGRILRTWVEMEPKDIPSLEGAVVRLSENCQRIRNPKEAENILCEMVSSTRSEAFALSCRINLMQLYHEFGRSSESESMRKEIEAKTRDMYALIRCRIQEAFNLRAQEQFEQALAILNNIPIQFGEAESHFLAHAETHCAFLLCCMGRIAEGQEALGKAQAFHPGLYSNSYNHLPFFLAQKQFAAAAESLLSDYRNSKELVSSWAELGIKAGILHDLAGMDAEAKIIFKEVSLRFPNEQVRFFGPMAHALYSGKNFDFTEMPYEAHRRSEMFYLLGLLMEKRGETEAARQFFELSVAEDPALRWPAFFAKKRIAECR